MEYLVVGAAQHNCILTWDTIKTVLMVYVRTAVALLVGWVCVMPARAQQDVCQQRTIPVSVETKDATPAPELSSANLEGSYRNRTVHVKLVALEQRLPRIILLLDTSGSMQEKLSQSLDVAEDLLSSIPPATEVGLAFFAKDFQPVVLPTADHQKLKYQLEGLRRNPSSYKGKTALWVSVLQSVKMLGNPHMGDAIYLISDGGDNASNSSKQKVAITLTQVGVRMFAVAFPAGGQLLPSPEETVGRAEVEQVSEDTGGTDVVFAGMYIGHFPSSQRPTLHDNSGQPTQFGFSLDEQYRMMLNFYRVDIDLPETVDKPQEWKFALVGLSKSQRDKLELSYPHLLVPCH